MDTLTRERIMGAAKPYLGAPYKWGGNDCKGVDCSGLTQRVFASLGHALPRLGRDQYAATRRVPIEQAQAGDMVFLANTTPKTPRGLASHVGIFLGDGNVLAANSKRGVVVQPMKDFASSGTFLGAGRLPGLSPAEKPTMTIGNNAGRTAKAAPQAARKSLLDDPRVLQLLASFGAAPSYSAPPPYPDLESPDAPTVSGYADIPGVPFFQRPTLGPSARGKARASLEEAMKARAAVNPYAADVARAQADKAYYGQMADSSSPDAPYQPPDVPAANYPDIPQRGAVSESPVGQGLAALFGLVDPQNAGGYAGASLGGAVKSADQHYQDTITRYNEAFKRAAMGHEEALNNRNERIRTDLMNRSEKRTAAEKIAELRAEAARSGAIIPALQSAGRQSQTAQTAENKAQLDELSLQDVGARNAPKIAEYNAKLQAAKEERQQAHDFALDENSYMRNVLEAAKSANSLDVEDVKSGAAMKRVMQQGANSAANLATRLAGEKGMNDARIAAENKRASDRLAQEKMHFDRTQVGEKLTNDPEYLALKERATEAFRIRDQTYENRAKAEALIAPGNVIADRKNEETAAVKHADLAWRAWNDYRMKHSAAAPPPAPKGKTSPALKGTGWSLTPK